MSSEAEKNLGEKIDLTNSQMKIWSGQFLNPEKPLYNMVLAFEINGAINVDRFKSAFQTLINQHDVLRSVIHIEDNLPKQSFCEKLQSQLEYIDLSQKESPREYYCSWVEENKGKVFETEDLLYESKLFKLDHDKYIWYINQHHLITDGVSMSQVYLEMSRHYLADKKEISSNTLRYEDYAITNPNNNDNVISPFWSEKQEEIKAPPALFGNKLKKTKSDSTRITVNLGRERTERLKKLANVPEIRAWTLELALYHVFLTVINTLVFKLSNQNEFNIGTPSHNRFERDHKNIVGLFMELIPVFAKIDDNDTLLSLFQRTRDEAFASLKNTSESSPPVELLRSFNVVLNFVPFGLGDFADYPMKSEWFHSGHSDSAHHLRLQIQDFDNQGDYKLLFDLNNEVFLEPQRAYVVEHFINLVDVFIENKQKKISDISIISRDEITLIKQWNDTDVEYPENETMLSEFERQVKSTPENIALCFDSKSLTYSELEVRVNQLAHFLIKSGVKPHDIVAVQMERSFEMLIGIYAILKAGAAYLPIDTKAPLVRTQFMLSDANVSIILTSTKAENIDLPEVLVLKIEQELIQIQKEPITKPEILVDPESLAYIIYTSGSTGKPKGVKCHHKGICNRLRWMNEKYPLNNSDVIIQKTPITFDVSVWELFWPLQQGAQLVIEKPDNHKESSKLIETILENQVTFMHFVPSMLNAFLENPKASTCKSLKRVFVSGETLNQNTVNKFHSILDCELYNLYGPTEACVDVSSWNCVRSSEAHSIPIGHPVANTKLYVLDNNQLMNPIGVPGELFIAGRQVAKGYINRETLSNEVFIKDAFSVDSKAIMYKTGDLARYRNDGAIEFLGRKDHQIKLRGFRIELAEIELTIDDYPEIQQSVVILSQKENKPEYLVAYYTGGIAEPDKIQLFLHNRLPEYMVPTFFVHISAFELTSNGKVDRKKLPNYNIEENQKENSYQAPESELEKIIVEVWQQVLQIQKIGVKNNFIQLGGDSLSALLITSRLTETLEMDLPVDLIFDKSNIASYAEYVEKLMMDIMENEA